MSRSADPKPPKSGAAASGAAANEVPFDERLRALEAIAQELEQGELGLERSIERYQQGVELLRTCHAQLALYQARVEELAREAAPLDEGQRAEGETGGNARGAR